MNIRKRNVTRRYCLGTEEFWIATLLPCLGKICLLYTSPSPRDGLLSIRRQRQMWYKRQVKYLYEHKKEKCHQEILLRDGRVLDRNSAPMFGQNEEYLGRVWYFRDITELKQTEAALRASEQRLKLAVASGQVGIWDLNLQTNELIWDDTMFALYGARREDYSGTYDAWSTRLHPEDRAATEAALQDLSLI